MRIGEGFLIALALVGLAIALRPRSSRARLVFAVISLLALAAHLVLEGARWQLAFPYCLIVLELLWTAGQAMGYLKEFRISRVGRGFLLALTTLPLALAAFVAQALPVFSLPKPTGSLAVGTRYVYLTDSQRNDPFRSDKPLKRELAVRVFYPARPDESKPFTTYYHGSSQLLKAMASFYGMPNFAFSHLRLVRSHSKENLQALDVAEKFPVVLFSHGAGASMETAVSLCEDLASHGYVVMSIDHPYASAATEFPDRIVTAREATTDFKTPEPAEPITRIMADDAQFVIDSLSGDWTKLFRAEMDREKIGVIGHSVGGAVAYDLAFREPRVKAAVNLDGVVYVAPKTVKNSSAFLMIANDRYHVQAIEKGKPLTESPAPGSDRETLAAYERAVRNARILRQALHASGNFYTILGSDHMKFTDLGLFVGSRWLRELLQIRGDTSPARCLTISQALAVTFFDQRFKRAKGERKPNPSIAFPELKRIVL
jgi:predicted dienelactone hydrolase